MCQRFHKIPAVFALTFAAQAALPLHDEQASNALTLGACTEHLQALVSQLQGKAQQQGNAILVEWSKDGSVILRYPNFAQRMFCENGVLLVDYPGPAAITQ